MTIITFYLVGHNEHIYEGGIIMGTATLRNGTISNGGLHTFSPLAFSSKLLFWYDPSYRPTVIRDPSEIVSKMNNKKIGASNATATAPDEPTFTENIINGRPGIFYNGLDIHMRTGINWPIEFEFFAVVQHTSFASLDRILSSYDGSGALTDGEVVLTNIGSDDTVRLFTVGNSISSAPITQVTGTPILYSACADSSGNTELFYNGVSLATGTTSQTVETREIYISEDRVQSSASGSKTFGLIAGFAPLTAAERLQMNLYCSRIWGMTLGSVPFI